MYPPELIEHFQNPRNVGELPPPAVTVEVSNPACGDILRLAESGQQQQGNPSHTDFLQLPYYRTRPAILYACVASL